MLMSLKQLTVPELHPRVQTYLELVQQEAQRRVDLSNVDSLFMPSLCAMYLHWDAHMQLHKLGGRTDLIKIVERQLIQCAEQLLPRAAWHVNDHGDDGNGNSSCESAIDAHEFDDTLDNAVLFDDLDAEAEQEAASAAVEAASKCDMDDDVSLISETIC